MNESVRRLTPKVLYPPSMPRPSIGYGGPGLAMGHGPKKLNFFFCVCCMRQNQTIKKINSGHDESSPHTTSTSLFGLLTIFAIGHLLHLPTLPLASSLYCLADVATYSGQATGFCSSLFLAAPPPCFQHSYSSTEFLLLHFLVVNRDSWHTVPMISNGCDATSCLPY